MPYQSELQTQFSAIACQAIGGSNALTVAGAGTTQATATALAAVNNLVTTGANNSGVILPSGKSPFDQCNVGNTVGNNICVYPPVGGNLNGQATNAPCIMAANSVQTFYAVSNLNWLADSI